ncbi:unnamed protein product [Diabrotica balteata]|uniref:Uncharacterized protein n=1 Tax=Diabrotica balteata TaxID=107213 RepID=A0A9N9T9J4_DIABA|nr:unnamed protein product [Diabrotica balteata]
MFSILCFSQIAKSKQPNIILKLVSAKLEPSGMAGYKIGYTVDEDNLILKLIIDTKAYYVLRGRAYWVDLVTTGLFDKCRTWMSLQNRFEKKILPNIMNPNYTISEEEKHKLVLAWQQSADDFRDSGGSDDDDDDDDDTDIDEDN